VQRVKMFIFTSLCLLYQSKKVLWKSDTFENSLDFGPEQPELAQSRALDAMVDWCSV
jgi:hypothetical protein